MEEVLSGQRSDKFVAFRRFVGPLVGVDKVIATDTCRRGPAIASGGAASSLLASPAFGRLPVTTLAWLLTALAASLLLTFLGPAALTLSTRAIGLLRLWLRLVLTVGLLLAALSGLLRLSLLLLCAGLLAWLLLT